MCVRERQRDIDTETETETESDKETKTVTETETDRDREPESDKETETETETETGSQSPNAHTTHSHRIATSRKNVLANNHDQKNFLPLAGKNNAKKISQIKNKPKILNLHWPFSSNFISKPTSQLILSWRAS